MRIMTGSAWLLVSLSSAAYAQEAPNPQSFNSQLTRLQEGESAIPAPWEKKPSKPLASPAAEAVNRDPINHPAPIVYADSSDDFAKQAANLSPAAGTPAKPMVLAQADTAPVQVPNAATANQAPAYGRMVTPTKVGDGDYVQAPADGGPIDSTGGGAIPALPLSAMKTASGISYLSGGVGDEELTQLKSQGGDYNLHLLLSVEDGAYISEASVRILDGKGAEVAVIPNAGPYVFAKLPAGTYKIEVTNQHGVVKTTSAKVPASGFVKPQVRF